VSKLKDIHIGANVEAQLKQDLAAEQGAVTVYNAGVKQAAAADDNATRELLESILKDEEDHLDWIEAQFDQISQMGIQNYLAQQV